MAILLVLGMVEMRTSYAQAAIFTRIASGFGFEVAEGRSDRIRFPQGGPYDERLGYAAIPELTKRLDSLGFDLTHQARLSPSLVRWVDRGVYPVYAAKGAVGLRVRDSRGDVLVGHRFPRDAYRDFADVPELVWRTLVHIESQGMLEGHASRRNPAVEWDRLARGAMNLALRGLGSERPVPGGSTLATQIEKYRHSPDGRTRTLGDKARQMVSASLRVYAHGADTEAQRLSIITDYLNSVPLAGQVGHGEVMGVGEGLGAWYGTSFERANLVLRATPVDALGRLEQAIVYRQVLTLLVAQRRPSYYLGTAAGRESLKRLTDSYLRVLERDGVVPGWLAADARRLGALRMQDRVRAVEDRDRAEDVPGAGSVMSNLLDLTGTPGLYELRRLDAVAQGTLDATWSAEAHELFRSLERREFLEQEGFIGRGLLGGADPADVFYSVLLMERTDLGNVVRIQVDNYPGAMSLADASRLELGSTAKLRTLVTYLEVVEELHTRLAPLDPEVWHDMGRPEHDPITRWVSRRLVELPDEPLAEVLDAALDRTYSASPRATFATGGSQLSFSNFDNQFDARTLTVREAFRHSVNLPFIRLMRDLVEYEIGRLGTADLLSRRDDPRRSEYLVKFAEHEGAQYIRRFHAKYREHSGPEVFEGLLAERRLSPIQTAWAVRAVAPDIGAEAFGDLMRAYTSESTLDEARISELYSLAEPGTLPLSDLGHLARIHPLEIWVASERLRRPAATLGDLLEGGRATMLDVYGWLLRTSRTNAQDTRIRSILEIEAFDKIHARWHRLGYPFDRLAPSLGTAIGSSGDRPLALAELVGIIQNGGLSLPVVRVESLQIAGGTPYERRFARRDAVGERVMGREVAAALELALLDVVESGTGRRVAGSLIGEHGDALPIGGKTGTGDNRFRVYDARGRLVASRVVNRTASFAFLAGDRWFGVVTAYVAGPRAEEHSFTSALPAQLLAVLGRRLGPLESHAPAALVPVIPPTLVDDATRHGASTDVRRVAISPEPERPVGRP
ncbi:MAG: transglycosylase domain-containing protein [Gemmatimonadota bacterium]